jgi:hypothetical protein
MINNVTITWDGLLANLCRAIDDWNPEQFATERDYRDSLLAHLRSCAPGARIESEYRDSGTTADICVEWDRLLGTERVLIEMKRNLNTKAEYNRLVGQITDMKPGKNNIIVLLCGETSAEWLDRLKAIYKPSWLPPTMAILVQKIKRA